MRVATLLADADGIDLTSAEKQEQPGGSGEAAVLALTVEGTTEDVLAAVRHIGEGLPAGAGITVEVPEGPPPDRRTR